MKPYMVLSLFIIFIMNFTACHNLGYDPRTKKIIMVNDFYIDTNNSLHIRYNKDFQPYTHQYSKLDLNSSFHWKHLDSDALQREQNSVTFNNNQVIIKNNNMVISEKYLPTIADIAIATNSELSDKILLYTTFRDGRNFTWDKKTYIASIYNKKENQIYHFSVIDMDTHFLIHIIDKSDTETNNLLFYDNKINFMLKREIPHAYSSYYNVFKISTNKKASFCYVKDSLKITCFVSEDNNTIVAKLLFGELYPKEYEKAYSTTIIQDRGQPSMSSMILDDKDNLHLFYNDLHNVTGKFFLYKMYKKENPTVPLYEQKIYWK